MSKPVHWKAFSAVASILFALQLHAASPADYAVQVSASVSTSPAKITLSWPSFGASSYKIYRKNFGGTSWGSVVASLSGSATSWTDSGVSAGSAYEYQVVRSASVTGYGYIYAGVSANMIDGRGKVALVVDNTMSGPLASELDRLELDLIGDGWSVQRVSVSRSDSVGNVKNAIKATGARSVFLFGRVPVPYSGNFAPDGHADHTGAWPADVYYADWNGSWSDSSVSTTAPTRNQNDNVKGDGKFDQSSLPSDTECEIGRVDLSDMGQFGKSETELLRQYLNKDHAFRHAQWGHARKGVVDDNFGDYQGQAFASNGWRNFAPMFGAGNVVSGDFFSGSYLWGYGTGGGNYTSAAGVGSTSSFASGTSVVFTMLFGSYFGDWDSTNNFLRAPLCAPSGGLSASWSARPYWFYQHMGLGECIGYGARLSQNNGGLYNTISHSVRGVHMSLMGDPTLRLHAVKPPSGLSATSGGGVTLRWTASSDSSIVGYHVYRASSQKGSYTRLTSSPVNATSYTDGGVSSGTYYYMLRAVKLESCGSGSYYNPSQGVFASSGAGGGGGSVPSAPTGLSAAGGDKQISLGWNGSSGATSYRIKRSGSSGGTFSQVGTVSGMSYTDSGLTNGVSCYYVVTAVNSTGESGGSNQASATPAALPTGGSLPSPWQERDIGSVGVAGSASYSSGTFTVKGSGADIWGSADGFHFVYQPLNGDGQIVARVASLQNTDPWAKAGVMIRDGLNPNGAHAMSVVSIANGSAFQRRLSTGGATEHSGSSGTVPYWVKLVRTGSTIAGYVSSNNSTWTKIDSCTLSLGSSVYVGLVVTSHSNGALCSAAFDNVSVTTGGTPPPPPPPPPPPGTGGDIPGKIQAEDYCSGGEGVAYHDVSSKNDGGAYRTEAVDIGPTTDVGGGYYVGWTAAAEWLMYDIKAASADSYTFTLRTATTKSGMNVHLEVDGVKVGSTATVPNTGGWESWTYTTISGVNIPAGAHKLKLVFETGNISVNYITATSSVAGRTAATLASVSATPSPAKAMEAVGFTAATANASYGSDADPIAIVWDFGDGTYDVGNTPAHTYTAGGDYAVRVTVSDSAGNSQDQALALPVAAMLEGNAGALNIRRLIAGINFGTENRDMLRLDAVIEVAADANLINVPVSIDCGGAVVQGTLDARGRARLASGMVKVTRVRGTNQAVISVQAQRMRLAAALENEGVRNQDVLKAPIAVPVTVKIGGQSFSGTFDGTYSSRSGRTGRVK